MGVKSTKKQNKTKKIEKRVRCGCLSDGIVAVAAGVEKRKIGIAGSVAKGVKEWRNQNAAADCGFIH